LGAGHKGNRPGGSLNPIRAVEKAPSACLLQDSQRVAYTAQVGKKVLFFGKKKQFVVVDGREGEQYDGIVIGGRIIFDSPTVAFSYYGILSRWIAPLILAPRNVA